jgi:hypothetical protein
MADKGDCLRETKWREDGKGEGDGVTVIKAHCIHVWKEQRHIWYVCEGLMKPLETVEKVGGWEGAVEGEFDQRAM